MAPEADKPTNEPNPPFTESWDMWADYSVDLEHEIQEVIRKKLEGRSDTFKAAIHSALVEHFAEEVRRWLHLPERTPDGQ